MSDPSNTDHSSEGEIRVSSRNKNLKIDAASGVPANEDLRVSGIALCEYREFPNYDLVSTRDVSNTHDPTVLEQQAASNESKFRQNDAMDGQGALSNKQASEPTASMLVYTSAAAEASCQSAKDGPELLAIYINRMLKMQQDILINEHARTLQG